MRRYTCTDGSFEWYILNGHTLGGLKSLAYLGGLPPTSVYGVRKVWRAVAARRLQVARCTVERLMAGLGLQGASRGKPVRTTISDKAAPCPLDHVNRQFHALGRIPVGLGLHLRLNLGGLRLRRLRHRAYARRIVGWRVSGSTCELRGRCAGAGPVRGGPPIAAGLYITATAAPIRVDQVHRAIGGGGHRAFGGQHGRQL